MIEELVRFKAGVKRDGVHPQMYFWLGVVARDHHEVTQQRLRVTSMRRKYVVGVRSRHSPKPPMPATAADIGRHELDRIDFAEDFCRDLQLSYGKHLGVVLEPEWLTVRQLERRFGLVIKTAAGERAARRKVKPHIHLQLKGELWTLD